MPGGKHRRAYLHRAERTGYFQIQLSEEKEMQFALRQKRVLGAQKQMAEVLVKPSVVALDGLAEERAGWMESPWVAQLLLVENSLPRFLNHWNPAVVQRWATWAGPF